MSISTRDLLTDRLSGRDVVSYPDPFFDLANYYIPRNIKQLFKFCKGFFYTNSFLKSVITKLSEYPITDLHIEHLAGATSKKIEETEEKDFSTQYKEAFFETLKIKSFLIEMGLDYFTYGNCFVSTFLTGNRFAKCKMCGDEHNIKDIGKLKLKKMEFFGVCPSCNNENFLTIRDEAIKSIKNFRLIRFDPLNLDIDYNPITGTSVYHYNIPNRIKQELIKGTNRSLLYELPLTFIQAVKEKKAVLIDPTKIFHMKFPSLAEEDMGWGKPMILPALKDIYYLQTLRRGNEAITQEHIVPKKAIYPANTTVIDPFTSMNMSKWKGEIMDTMKKWKKDPNHIGIFPIPIGYQELGGNARMLLLTPEMKFLEETIINSLGVPIEFIKGGTSWTGSSISLRIVENHFLSYRELLQDFLNYFLVPQIKSSLGWPKVKLSFTKFKMTDDAQHKQLITELNIRGKLSDATLLKELGFDYEVELENIAKSREDFNKVLIGEITSKAEADGQAQIILAKYQVRAQKEMNDETFKMEVEALENELQAELGSIPDDMFAFLDKMALKIMYLPDATRENQLRSMEKKMPNVYTTVMSRMQQYAGMMENAMLNEPPLVDGKPGSRGDGKKVKQIKSEKTKGQTTGQA